jgi:hypothetical protein
MAPEYGSYGEITARADMYSLGIIIMDLLVGHDECKRFVGQYTPGGLVVDQVITIYITIFT